MLPPLPRRQPAELPRPLLLTYPNRCVAARLPAPGLVDGYAGDYAIGYEWHPGVLADLAGSR